MPERTRRDVKQVGKKATLEVAVYRHIFDAILEFKLAPGTRLKEEELTEIFDVSRTIIRAALGRLHHEGVVEMIPNKGAFVANPNIDDAKQILEARRLIELAVVERAVDQRVEIGKGFDILRDMVELEHQKSQSGDKGGALRLSGEFHLRLAEFCGNAPLSGFLRSLVPQTSLIIALYQVSEGKQCSIDEHFELVEAIENGEKEKAVQLMGVHLDHIESRLSFTSRPTSSSLAEIFSNARLS